MLSCIPLILCEEDESDEEDEGEDSEPPLPSDRFLIRRVGVRAIQSEIYANSSKKNRAEKKRRSGLFDLDTT